jgi:hypothetical protein
MFLRLLLVNKRCRLPLQRSWVYSVSNTSSWPMSGQTNRMVPSFYHSPQSRRVSLSMEGRSVSNTPQWRQWRFPWLLRRCRRPLSGRQSGGVPRARCPGMLVFGIETDEPTRILESTHPDTRAQTTEGSGHPTQAHVTPAETALVSAGHAG